MFEAYFKVCNISITASYFFHYNGKLLNNEYHYSQPLGS